MTTRKMTPKRKRLYKILKEVYLGKDGFNSMATITPRAKINSAGLTGKCWQCGKKTFTHKASVITSTGLRELELCDTCHLYWGGD